MVKTKSVIWLWLILVCYLQCYSRQGGWVSPTSSEQDHCFCLDLQLQMVLSWFLGVYASEETDRACHTWEAKHHINPKPLIIMKQSLYQDSVCLHAHFVCCLILPSSGCATAGFFPGRRWAWPSLLPLLLFVFLRSPSSSWATGGVAWQLTVFCDVDAVFLSLDFFA